MTTSNSLAPEAPAAPGNVLDAHVTVVTNFIAAHRMPLYHELHRRVRKLTVLLSTPMEADRKWQAEFGPLDVRFQKTTTLKRPRRHQLGFKDSTWVHIPWDTVERLKELRPDLIISAEFGFRSLFAARYAGKHRVPLVYWAGLSEHTEKGKGSLRWLLRKWLVRRGTGVFVNGNSGARYLQKLGFRPEQIHRLYYTALPELHERGSDERELADTRRLLFVGRLIEVKGLLPFLQALCRWAERHPERKIEFSLAGSGQAESVLRAMPLPGNLKVCFLGEQKYEQLIECYRAAGIFVFPSLADDWGMVVNEALASGLPILGSIYSQGVDELVVEGETGWRYRPDHPEEVESALDRAFSTPVERLAEMRKAAREKVAHLTPQYSAELFVKSLDKIYQNYHRLS